MSAYQYLGMKPGDLAGKPYAKYWKPDMEPMQEHAQRAVLHGIEAAELGFQISDADQLLDRGYLPLENGFTRLENGQIFVAVLTALPRVTAKMLDWWFGWHYMEKERYKLWHPRAHMLNRARNMIGDDPGRSDREKYLNTTNFVTEYVGGESLDITIDFEEPSKFLDVSRFAEAGVGTAFCGVVGYQRTPMSFGLLIHLIRETENGCEMRSRFWLGKIEVRGFPAPGILNKIAGASFVARNAVPQSLGREMLVHCTMEMNHLASFLPDLYADYH